MTVEPGLVLALLGVCMLGASVEIMRQAMSLKKDADDSLALFDVLKAEIEREIDASHRDAAEAFMLWNHGAQEEAIELLKKRGARVRIKS